MDSFFGLLNNAALMLVFCVIYDMFDVYAISNKKLRDYTTGVLVGLISIAVMLTPWSLQPGVFFDTRWVLLSLSGLFFGLIPTVIAVIIAGTFRLYQGGPGGTVGTVVIVITACVGLAWRYWKEKHNKPLGWLQLYAFGITVQLAMLSCIFLMPAGMRLPIIKAVAPPILIIFPVVTLLIGYILKRQEDRRHVHEVFRQYEKIVSSSSDMMALMDKQYRFIAANKAYLEAFGLTQKQLARKNAADVLGEKFFNTSVKPNADRCLRGENVNFQNWTDFPSNEKRFMDINYYPYYGEDDTIMGYVVNGRDITKRKMAETEKAELEEKLRQSQKMEAIGTMAGGIAHDFNNILTIINGNAEIAKDDITAENPARENIEEIQKASNRAKDLVSQILAFSRKEKKELIAIQPQSMIKETLKFLRSITPTTVSIIQNISEDCSLIRADPTGLHQLLMNLFANAVHSMNEKGKVSVSLQNVNLDGDNFDKITTTTQFFSIKKPGKYVRLSVTDHGTGMDSETVKRIFDPFYTTKEVGKGTGMGLSVVHGIIESHGGFIDVESKPGQGSTFHVFLPITEEEEAFEAKATILPQKGTERILFIDDEESLLTLGKRILESLDYKVTTESNSLKALEIFKAAPDQFDLIITDQAMPNMSGSEFISEIVKVRPGIPIILCTGYSSKISEENAKDKGISKFINKPYSKKVLSESIREVLMAKVSKSATHRKLRMVLKLS